MRAQWGEKVKRRSFRVDADGAVGAVLEQGLQLSAPEAKALVERGAVYLQGRRVRSAEAPARAGQTVMVVEEESGLGATQQGPVAPALRILFEDDALLVVDKPAGVTAQPTPGRVGESLLDFASEHLGKDAGLVHRLDRQTSGVTVFGKSPEATSELAAQFRKGRARKRYLAVTASPLPPSGTIDLKLSRDPSRIGRWRASRTANGLSALTVFERLHQGDGFTLVALYPATGRTHQLRAHLRALDAPIAGDGLYGGPPTAGGLSAPRCLLHAHALALAHPRTGEAVVFEAPLPEDLAAFFARAQVAPPSGPPAPPQSASAKNPASSER